jgi:hypothetical protein
LPGCWPAHQNIGWKTQKTLQRKWNKKTKKEKMEKGKKWKIPKKKGGRKQREIRRKVLQARTYRIKF